MKKFNYKKTIIYLFFIHIALYFLIGNYMLENQFLYEFKVFNERRILNKSNKSDATKLYYFSSCGDEFFRDYNKIDKFISCVIEKNNYRAYAYAYDNIINNFDYYYDIPKLYNEKTNAKFTQNCIIFNVCRLNKIPLIYTNIKLVETFSADTDFHGMMYRNQIKTHKIHYVWFLFKWIKIVKYQTNPV